MPVIRTFLFSPNYVSLMGWKQIINDSPYFHVDGCATYMDGLSMLGSSPTLILADLSQSGGTVIDQISKLVTQPNIDALFVVDLKHQSYFRQLKEMGCGMFTTRCGVQEIEMALESIRLGKKFYCADIMDVLMESVVSGKTNHSEEVLSTREIEVLEWVVKGLTTNQIAGRLNLSMHTINSHRKNMLKKLNLDSPAKLIAHAVNTGLIDLNSVC